MKIYIWEARTEKNITLEELAEMSGIGRSTINDLENGKRPPNLFQMECIARALDLSICELVDSEYLFYHDEGKKVPCCRRFPRCGKSGDKL